MDERKTQVDKVSVLSSPSKQISNNESFVGIMFLLFLIQNGIFKKKQIG